MNRDEIRKLLGGYATGTLTPAEQQALFEAALEDQELFDELGKDQPLRDVLRDPSARAQLLAALDPPRRWWQLWQVRAGAALALAGIVTAIVVVRPNRPAPRVVEVAAVRPAPGPPALSEEKQAAAAADDAAARRGTAQPDRAKPAAKELAPSRPPVAAQPAGQSKSAAASDSVAGFSQPDQAQPSGAPPVKMERRPAPPPPIPSAAPPPPPAPPQGASEAAGRGAPAQEQGTPPQEIRNPFEPVPLAQTGNFQNARAIFYGNRGAEAPNDQSAAAAARRTKVTGPVAGTGGMISAVNAPAANLGLRISVLRRRPDGTFETADPQNLGQADAVRLQIIPNDSGFLSIQEAGPSGPVPVTTRSASRMTPVNIDIAPPGRAATKQLLVSFARRPGEERGVTLVRARLDQTSYTDPDEKATYLANTKAGPVSQAITLRYK